MENKSVNLTSKIVATSPSMENPVQFFNIGEAAEFAKVQAQDIVTAIESGEPIKIGNIEWYFDESL